MIATPRVAEMVGPITAAAADDDDSPSASVRNHRQTTRSLAHVARCHTDHHHSDGIVMVPMPAATVQTRTAMTVRREPT